MHWRKVRLTCRFRAIKGRKQSVTTQDLAIIVFPQQYILQRPCPEPEQRTMSLELGSLNVGPAIALALFVVRFRKIMVIEAILVKVRIFQKTTVPFLDTPLLPSNFVRL